MTYDEISPTIRNFLGAREALRKLGFSADHIFCNVSRSALLGGKYGAFCTLRAQGKEFNVECGLLGKKPSDFIAEYKLVCANVNLGVVPQEDLDRIWQESEVFKDKVSFAAALLAKGFTFPKGQN